MNKISPRDIQLFVAGALGLMGFRVSIVLPYYFFASSPMLGGRIFSSLLTALALPIGIAILSGRQSAIVCAQIYLWVMIVSGCVAIAVYYFSIPKQAGGILWRIVPELLVAAVLLALIY